MSLAAIVFLLLLFVGLPYLQSRTQGQITELPRPEVYVSATISLWFLAGLLGVVLWIDGEGVASVGWRGLPWNEGILYTLASLGASLILVAVAYAVRRKLGQSESEISQFLIPRTRREKLIMAFWVSPTAGIVEETVYRGFAMTQLAPFVGGPWIAAALVAAGFALGHLYQGALGAVRAGILGFVLAIPYILSGSLLPSIVAHAAIDAIYALWLSGFVVDEVEQ